MRAFIVKTESEAAAKLLLAFLKTVRLVKSITPVADETKTGVVNEPAEEYNWINPDRPATEEEIEKMLEECEAEEGIPAKEAREKTLKELREWETTRKR
ncbi:MAG: hypothetical protein HY063_03165 [Bacteroidetes bacterium]|nr:hypothetical protein [Bacteroidota bacterium]